MVRVFLIGLPAVGKSTLGPLLSTHLGLNFADSDALVKERYGLAPADQIVLWGSFIFRWREAAELRRWLASNNKGLLVCGGGLPAHFGGIDLLRRNGLVVWLELPVEEWLARLAQLTDRPLLRNSDGRFSREQALLLRQKRINYYAKAHLKLYAPDSTNSLLSWIEESAQKVQCVANNMKH